MNDSESALVRRLLLASGPLGARLFRNSVGRFQDAHGRWVTVGLHVGSPDLVGWQARVITPADVGRTLAVFVGVEAKRVDGRLTEQQRAFLTALARDGAACGVARSVEDLALILGKGAISCGRQEP